MRAILMGLLLLVAAGGYGQSQAGSWPPAAVGETSGACTGSASFSSSGQYGLASGALATVQWPMNKVVAILRAVRPQFPGWNLGQMIQEYHQCNCVITYLGEGLFLVRIGGGSGITSIGDDF